MALRVVKISSMCVSKEEISKISSISVPRLISLLVSAGGSVLTQGAGGAYEGSCAELYISGPVPNHPQ